MGSENKTRATTSAALSLPLHLEWVHLPCSSKNGGSSAANGMGYWSSAAMAVRVMRSHTLPPSSAHSACRGGGWDSAVLRGVKAVCVGVGGGGGARAPSSPAQPTAPAETVRVSVSHRSAMYPTPHACMYASASPTHAHVRKHAEARGKGQSYFTLINITHGCHSPARTHARITCDSYAGFSHCMCLQNHAAKPQSFQKAPLSSILDPGSTVVWLHTRACARTQSLHPSMLTHFSWTHF
eukprot:360116-Chlamydomonas_euryale.AAC.2